MIKNILITLLISFACSLAVVLGSRYLFDKQGGEIGFVKSGVIIQEYKEMKEANAQFEKELQMAQANADTLKNRYLNLKREEETIPENKKKDWSYRLGIAQNEFAKYSEQVNEQMDMRKQELTKGVLEKINSFIQKYGKENNYKMILGTTNDGSILYGSEADDLTETILNQLNGNNSQIDKEKNQK